MRILTVCRSLGLGGTERAAETFTLGYRDAGHETAVLNLGPTGPREDKLLQKDISVFHNLDEAVRFDPQIIHIHRRGQKDEYETTALKRLRTDKRRVLETNVFAWADYSKAEDLIDVHLLLSRWCLWAWRRRLGRMSPAVVLPYPLMPQQFCRANFDDITRFRAKWTPGASFVCGRVAQPLPGKWHAANITGFLPLAQRDPNAYLLLIGLPDSMRTVLKSVPSDLRARIRVIPMTSSDEELSLFYSSLDCFLHVAHQGESFGYVLAEAMMCGCPVVTVSLPTRDNSQLEVVGHEQGGLVVGSIEDIGDAVLRLWADSELRKRISMRCRSRILEMCETQILVKLVLRLAELALKSDNRNTLLDMLSKELQLITNVNDDEIRKLAENVLGRPRGLSLMKFANSSFEHHCRQFIRKALGR